MRDDPAIEWHKRWVARVARVPGRVPTHQQTTGARVVVHRMLIRNHTTTFHWLSRAASTAECYRARLTFCVLPFVIPEQWRLHAHATNLMLVPEL